MKKLVILTALLYCTSAFTQSPYRNIKITDENTPSEVTISFNPINPLNLVAAANIETYFYSFDGGYTWATRKLTSTYGVYGDPCIVADLRGNFYYFHLSNSYEEGARWLDRIICQKSDDGGITWSNGSYMGANPPHLQDKEWAAVDHSYSPYRNNIYTAWTQCGQNKYSEEGTALNPMDSASNIIFSFSSDGGETWAERKRINEQSGNECSDAGATVLGVVPCVGLNGEVYLTWCSPFGIMLDRSTDGGMSFFEKDIKVADLPGSFRMSVPGVYRTFGFPSMSCDMSSGKYRGTLYISWADQKNGYDNTDIWISRSSNEGITWSEPAKVNDDSGSKHQFYNWLTIDQETGIIYVVFYDRRNYDDERTDVYLASSTDGGRTFLNERISEEPFYPLSETFMGDYTNVVAVNGMVRPIWTRLDSNSLSIWSAIIDK
ncbi:MAG: exo-alpha-sialidase [Ignavibacteria bacterium]|nr:exo-alpha-sialidase [Ignavibacteria bacterium]